MERREFVKAGASLAILSGQIAGASAASPRNASVRSSGLNDRRRFLDQATMGARPGEAAALTGSFQSWIETQFSMPYTTIDFDAAFAAGFRNTDPNNNLTRRSVFARWCNEDAQLRFRVSHVLQQIVCAGSATRQSTLDSLLWWNGLMRVAFQNYRDLLKMAVTHRYMGEFLNNKGNNAFGGRPPSQNFARELLQLFSTGLDMLNKDGSLVRNAAGEPVPAYSQAEVEALARLLSGWDLPHGNFVPGQDGTQRDGTMQISTRLAYNGPEVTFRGVRFPQIQLPSAADVTSRMEACLDLIMNHPSTAPYVSKQFIQKMVTDTPTPGYIRRVTAAFENNGAGVRGDLKAVVMAVLLDAEARGNTKPASFGRAQEWVLSLTKGMRYAQMERLHDAYSSRGGWFASAWAADLPNGSPDGAWNVLGEMGQAPMNVASVFNDYPFKYQINGVEAPASAMWGAPEIMANVARVLSSSSQLGNPIPSTNNDLVGRWQLTALISQYRAVEAATEGSATQKQRAAVTALVDQVFADLNQGRPMTPAARSGTIDFIDIDCAALPVSEKLAWLINFVRCLPEYSVVV